MAVAPPMLPVSHRFTSTRRSAPILSSAFWLFVFGVFLFVLGDFSRTFLVLIGSQYLAEAGLSGTATFSLAYANASGDLISSLYVGYVLEVQHPVLAFGVAAVFGAMSVLWLLRFRRWVRPNPPPVIRSGTVTWDRTV